MKTSDLVFVKQFYYTTVEGRVITSTPECPNLLSEARGFLSDNNVWQSQGYLSTKISSGTNFTFVRAAKIEYQGLYGLGEGSGDYYLLKNDNNEVWYIRSIYLNNANAAYYQNGKRVSPVDVP